MSGPLDGILILDWTIWQQGPVATAMLADLGADVIKMEEREGGDPGRGLMKLYGTGMGWQGRNFYFETNNRNKRSIALDLRHEKAKEIVGRLVSKADVFVQNFRKGVAARLGLDYDTLSSYNSRLIYATASGYGPRGPESDQPCFDLAAQARSGLMYASLEPGVSPQRFGGAIADQIGAIMLAYGILAALLARERSGVGQEVDASQLGSLVALQGLNIAQMLAFGAEPTKQARAKAGNPLSNHYKCADDKWITPTMLQSDRYWPSFCQALGIERLEKNPRFDSGDQRARNCEQLVGILDEIFVTDTSDQWIKALRDKGCVVDVVKSIKDLADDPQVIENGYIIDFDHPVMGWTRQVGIPVILSKTPGSLRREAPEHGQHTEEVLIEIAGYDWPEIIELKELEII